MTDFKKFLEKFPPPANPVKPSEETISFFEGKLPADLISFWKEYGFGDYGNGIIKVINPEEHADVLGTWLGRAKDWSRIPILVSGFGDLFYYRQINETAEDVSVVDLHYRKIKVCTDYISYSLQFFFEEYIVDEGYPELILRKTLFDAAVEKCGVLKPDEIYFFAPALIMGGGEESIAIVEKGIGTVHQELLFQMGS